MAIDGKHVLRSLFGGRDEAAAPNAAPIEAARYEAEFGFRLVGLSGPSGHESVVAATEMLSPLLIGLVSGERFGLDISLGGTDARPLVGLSGLVTASTAPGAVTRRSQLSDMLASLMHGQFPGLVARALREDELALSTFGHETGIVPRGRWLTADRLQSDEPGPKDLAEPAGGVLLPSMTLAPERIAGTIAVLKALGQPARLRLDLAHVALDASALRRIAAVRDAASRGEPRSTLETMRHLALAVPDDALLTAYLNDRHGIRLDLTVATCEPLGEASRRMLCHGLFGTEPADQPRHSGLDLASVYPTRFALGSVIGGLAARAVETLRRPSTTYAPPQTVGIVMGHTPDGRAVAIADEDRAMHTFLIGATGTGKSTALLNQIVHDMEAGCGCLLVDPHGDLFEAARALVPHHRRQDVVLADLGDIQHAFTMNVLAGLGGDPAVERSATINGLLRLFQYSLWPGVPEAFGPMFELYFRNALLLQMGAEGDAATILGVERVFQDDAYRAELLKRCDDQYTVDFWRRTAARVSHHEIDIENIAPYIIAKLSPFTSNALLRPILAAPTESLDIRAAITGGKIVLVNLAKGIVGAGAARLVGGLIVMRLVASAQTQMRLPEKERREFMAVLDEFQTYASEHVAEAIEETRKYKLRLTLACQSLGQVDGRAGRADVGRSIVANVANLVAFRLGVEDASRLARYFEPMFTPQDMMYLPNHVAVCRLLALGQALRPLEIKTAPPVRPADR